MIEVKNLVKKYGDHVAVDHLTFTVEKGQIYGFLGPNGAGKSTTMNIMTGYIGATEGEVLIDGHDILKDAEAAKRCIGYLPEIPPVYPDMTVEEYLQFSAELKGIKKEAREAQIEKVMRMTQVEEVANRLIKNLSKGYRQRVGLAHAIMGFPPIIILDEPTVGLDPKQIIEIRELIKKLSKEHTIILSSHILSEISEVCDYVMIIARGKLIASDTTKNLTKMMQGQNVYDFLVKGSEKQVREALGRVRGISKLDIKPSGEAGIVDVTAECQSGPEDGRELGEMPGKGEKRMDYREEIFYALAHAECPMMASSKYVSLEDIFLELTEEHQNTRSKKSKRRFLAKRQKEEAKREDPADPESVESVRDEEDPESTGAAEDVMVSENMEAPEITRENAQEVEDHGSNL